jgi:F-type H+-transporting ATPase subunit a
MWRFEDPIYSGIIILLLSLFFIVASRRLSVHPGKLQNLAEMVVGGLDGFIREVLGPHGRQFVPFLGTLGLYVYVMNVFGLIPLMKSPTSILETTAAMALTVFVYVQFTAIRMNGPLKYLHHLAGEPRDAIGWAMSPLMFPLHVIGEIAKPLSLALRLFGNIMGEDLLLVVFAGLGVAMLAATHLPIGVPLHLPFMFLGLLTTAIQATVFMLLSTIYISLVLPHDDHH